MGHTRTRATINGEVTTLELYGPHNSVYGKKGRVPTWVPYRTREAKVRCAYIKFDFNSSNKFQNNIIVHSLNMIKLDILIHHLKQRNLHLTIES